MKIRVLLDRVQFTVEVPRHRKPPDLEGFRIVKDCFVRRKTNTSTYARCRYLESCRDDSKISWQYRPLKGWLRPWKVTLIADDHRGLSRPDIARVLRHCPNHHFLLVEIAVDFAPSALMDRKFVRAHGVFGKSRREK